MFEPLTDRVVVIAGATGGLGSAVTLTFAQTEARLVLVSTSGEKLAHLADHAGLSAERVLTVPTDVTRVDRVDRLVGAVMARFGRVDALLNTVGGWQGGQRVVDTAVDDWEHMLTLNLRTAFLLSRAVLPPMLEAGWGRIVHVASKTAVEPRAKVAGYATSKMGLITLTEVIAAEVKGHGVTANVLLPSTIDTLANRRMMPEADQGKWVQPERIAIAMRFLCSEAAAPINGARIPIYGEA